jgi:CheY-like chemotaxis protein
MERTIPIFDNTNALIVEDNPISSKMMEYTLSNIGIHCEVAENGKIALDMRKKKEYDIIFMDIQMPIMDGIEATENIIEYEKSNSKNHIPIVAVTANTDPKDRGRLLSHGMDEYIRKPIDLDIFLGVLKKFLVEKNNTKMD